MQKPTGKVRLAAQQGMLLMLVVEGNLAVFEEQKSQSALQVAELIEEQ